MRSEFKWSDIKVAVGLGNPGDRYAYTFHNAGAQTLAAFPELSKPGDFSPAPKKPFRFLRSGGRAFVLPASPMNDAGRAVRDALSYFNATPHHLLVIHDDTDLPLGKFRFSFGRGGAGHRGVESIIGALGTKDFWRLRMGVRPSTERRSPPSPSGLRRIKAGDFVLRRMSPRERAELRGAAREAYETLTEKTAGR